jgi:hypothetical protein
MKSKTLLLPLVAALLSIFLIGCGGGGEGTQSQAADTGGGTQTLAWDPPQTYDDNTVMDPFRDLDYYEFYVRRDPNFTDGDAPVAQAAAVTSVLLPDGQSYQQELTSEFALANLVPFTEPGVVYYVSIRSVAVSGLKSDFSEPVVWNLS